MPMDMMGFMSNLNDAIIAENGLNLAYLLRPTSPHGKDLVKEFRNATRATFARYEGAMQSPWDEIAIQYILTCTHIAKRRHGDAFKEQSQLVSLFLRFFTENRGWTLQALFSILRDLRDLAFDADHHAKYNGQKSECMEDAARTIAKAFGNCMTDRRILAYLIALRILKGHLPSAELMQRFPLLNEIYAPFIAAIRVGDVASYDRALEILERRLVELNLWLTLEKARELCVRGLFRRVWVAADKSTRIPVSMFTSSLRISGIDASEDEAECLVANMIYKGFMRGYISHEKRMVVLAQNNAFPRLADRPQPFLIV
ncbi:hypothetical protein H0H92_004394 [Tricholoma furcatifolium]|nr:hypothetical protein H0H92_004394 [Tricholoma furcatifolium]